MMKRLLLSIWITVIITGCGGGGGAASVGAGASEASQIVAADNVSLLLLFDYGTTNREARFRLPSSTSQLQILVYDQGGALVRQETVGQVATHSLTGLPEGRLLIRLVVRDSSGGTLGYFDRRVQSEETTEVTFYSLYSGDPPEPRFTDLTSGTATSLAFIDYPSALSGGQSFSVSVGAFDDYGELVTSHNGTVTLSLQGALLQGEVVARFSEGRARFSDLTLEGSGASVRLQATTAGLPPALSLAFPLAPCDFHLPFRSSTLTFAPTDVTAADADGDGDLDLVSFDVGDPTLYFLTNQGEGDFTHTGSIPLTGLPGDVLYSELNGDEYLDLVTLRDLDGVVDVRLGSPTGLSSPTSYSITGNPFYLLEIADVDGANGPDILVLDSDIGLLTMLMNSGTGSFSRETLSLSFVPDLVRVGLVNADSIPDLLLVDNDEDRTHIFLGTGDGGYLEAPTLELQRNTSSLEVADLTGDDIPDVVAAQEQGFLLFPGVGDGTFLSPTLIEGPVRAWYLEILDWDKDFDRDIVFGGGSGGAAGVLTNDGAGNFALEQVIFPASSGRILPYDFTGDDLPDLLTSDSLAKKIFLAPRQTDGSLQGLQTFSDLRGMSRGATADLNGDGSLDIAVSSSTQDAIALYRNDSKGHFSEVGRFFSSHPGALLMGDVNQDGRVDIVANRAFFGSKTIDVHLNTGNFSFSPSDPVSVPRNVDEVALADFNKDGAPDLAVTNTDNQFVAILLNKNDGSGDFLEAVEYLGTKFDGGDIDTGDVDNDGDVDIVLTEIAGVVGGGRIIAVLRNDGTGNFSDRQAISTDYVVRGIELGDLNGDGLLDILVADDTNFRVVEFQNSGAAFVQNRAVAMGFRPRLIQTATLDLGQPLGFVTAFNNGGRVFSINQAEPDSSYGNDLIPVSQFVSSLLTGDFDGDGDDDIATVSSFGGHFGIYLSRCE